MKLVIADDESLVRYTLRSMINEMEAPWQIVGESSNGEELMNLLAEHQPNVAIVDIRMPKMNGLGGDSSWEGQISSDQMDRPKRVFRLSICAGST